MNFSVLIIAVMVSQITPEPIDWQYEGKRSIKEAKGDYLELEGKIIKIEFRRSLRTIPITKKSKELYLYSESELLTVLFLKDGLEFAREIPTERNDKNKEITLYIRAISREEQKKLSGDSPVSARYVAVGRKLKKDMQGNVISCEF